MVRASHCRGLVPTWGLVGVVQKEHLESLQKHWEGVWDWQDSSLKAAALAHTHTHTHTRRSGRWTIVSTQPKESLFSGDFP